MTVRRRPGRRRLGALHRPLSASVLGLTAFGVLMVFSAARGPAGELRLGVRQAVFALAGVTVAAVVATVDLRRLGRRFPALLTLTVVALAAVLTPLGTEVRGTQGWFRVGPLSLQPSEFAKLTLIVGLALVLGRPDIVRPGEPRGHHPHEREVPRFLAAVGLLAVLSALVVAQGESGTVLVYCAIALGMLTVARVPGRFLALLVVTGVAAIGLAISAGLLAPYQVDRFEAFLDADLDPLGIGYNQQQALTAVGSGGLVGAGLFDGPQTQLGYLPDQHTDFIFAAVAEELGFLGAVGVLVAEGLVLASILAIGRETRDELGRLVCAGVFALVAFQVVQNVAMNVRLMPITGISLPFVSYGGSSLVATLAAIGLVQSVAVHPTRHPSRHP